MLSEFLQPILRRVISDDFTHGRFLNTFSYLEYIGFRKIVKSQRAEDLTCEILGHASEESRHALLLKKLAIKVGGKAVDSYLPNALLCGEEAESYFQTLDDECCRILSKELNEAEARLLTYYYVTWLVEVRALEVYGAYIHALTVAGKSSSLSGLLAEEDRHLETVTRALESKDPKFSERLLEFKKIEAELYDRYEEALRTAVCV